MPQIINTNIASLNAQRNLNKSQSANQTALQRLSSGLRINSAKDDAAGLAISTRFDSQIRGLNVAVRNAGDGISLAQTAEGALGSMNDNLQRIRELAVQSANATNSDVDRDALQAEVDQLLSEVSRTAVETDFNGRKLLDGSFSATFQIGANAGQTLDVSIAELTSEKLGAAEAAGLTAIGNDQALSNGDLTINGVAIDASKAGDDTASTDNSAASAIAKVAAINAKYDETGVKATVSENVVSGSEMAGGSTDGLLTLNGVDISLSTTASTSQTRAGVVEAINAVSDQTGVIAVNSNSDNGGVQLIAEDGRNISISASNTLSAASTGLALNATASNQETYEGGYTLVADSDIASIEIQGGNGTGNGDLANAGLVAGSYVRGQAASVSGVQSSELQATKLTGGDTENVLADTSDNATLITGGTGVVSTTSANAVTAVGADQDFAVTVTTAGGAVTTVFEAVTGGTTIASAAAQLDAIAGVNAFERITFNIDNFTTNTGGGSLFLGARGSEVTISLPDDADGAFTALSDRLEYLTGELNAANYGADISLTAELNQAKTSIVVTLDNTGTDFIAIGTTTGDALVASAGGALTVTGNIGTAASAASLLQGEIAFTTSGAASVQLSLDDPSGAGTLSGTIPYVGTDYGSKAISTDGTNEVSVTVDGKSVGSTTVAAGSTVSDLASAVSGLSDAVNAWEEISLTFDATNLEGGDTIYLGAAGSAEASGTAIAVNDADGNGTVALAELVDSFNSTDFSAQNIDVSASLNSSGEMVLNIRNFSGGELAMVTSADSEGRSLQQATTNNLVGGAEQQLSGTLAYSSSQGEEINVSIADPLEGDEFYSGNSSSTTFTGVNGLDNGDIVINGVSIGEAVVSADKASAEFASDNTKILSSSKEKSGIAIAAAINNVAEETGVSATVNATEVVGGDGENVDTSQFEVGDSAEIYINGYVAGTVTLQDNGSGGIDTDRAKADALSVINSVSGKTGVEGVDNGVSLTLGAEDGRNISIAIDDKSGADASIGAIFGLDAAVAGIGESTFGDTPAAANGVISPESATYETTYSTVTLTSAGEFTLAAGSEGADELQALGFTEGKYGGAVQGEFLKDIDISTFEGATSALTSIDNALQSIASQRADLGAIQNRIESTVSNLAITSENLSAANSRIRDADFAAETAELSRTQVLQQAGISILAQANQGPQQVLSLLG